MDMNRDETLSTAKQRPQTCLFRNANAFHILDVINFSLKNWTFHQWNEVVIVFERWNDVIDFVSSAGYDVIIEVKFLIALQGKLACYGIEVTS